MHACGGRVPLRMQSKRRTTIENCGFSPQKNNYSIQTQPEPNDRSNEVCFGSKVKPCLSKLVAWWTGELGATGNELELRLVESEKEDQSDWRWSIALLLTDSNRDILK